MSTAVARISVFLLIGIVLAACETSQGMDRQTIAYNRAVSDSTNEFFLLNVLRAKERFPVYYSRTTGNTASASLNPSITYSLSGWIQSPSVTLGTSAGNTLSLANLDDQKFVRGVLNTVPLSILDSYFSQAWPRELLMMMFVKRIEIDRALATTLAGEFDRLCGRENSDAAATNTSLYCDGWRPTYDEPGRQEIVPRPSDIMIGATCNAYVSTDGRNFIFDNSPEHSNRLGCFEAATRVLIKLGLTPVEETKFKVIDANVPKGSVENLGATSAALTANLAISKRRKSSDFAICTKQDITGFTLDKGVLRHMAAQRGDTKENKEHPTNYGLSENVPSALVNAVGQSTTPLLAKPAQSCAEQASDDEASAGCDSIAAHDGCAEPPVFSFTTRSLDSMIYYLGEDLRAGGKVAVWNSQSGARATAASLFRVEQDRDQVRPLVSTQFRGTTYVIPDTCGERDNCEQTHRSLQVLSLLNQIWGLQKEAAEVPTVPVVSVVGH